MRPHEDAVKLDVFGVYADGEAGGGGNAPKVKPCARRVGQVFPLALLVRISVVRFHRNLADVLEEVVDYPHLRLCATGDRKPFGLFLVPPIRRLLQLLKPRLLSRVLFSQLTVVGDACAAPQVIRAWMGKLGMKNRSTWHDEAQEVCDQRLVL